MKTTGRMTMIIMVLSVCQAFTAVFAQGPAKDTAFFNNNGAGIPNSGNTLYPNNGPEFPHSAPLNPTTDPGPLFHGGNTDWPKDTVPH